MWFPMNTLTLSFNKIIMMMKTMLAFGIWEVNKKQHKILCPTKHQALPIPIKLEILKEDGCWRV